LEGAKLDQTLSYGKVSEACARLGGISMVNENMRKKVLKVVQEVEEGVAS